LQGILRIGLNPKRERGQKGPRGDLSPFCRRRVMRIFFSSFLGYRKIGGNLNGVWNVFFDRRDGIFVL